MTPSQFIDHLHSISLENTFNPYTDICTRYDKYNAPYLRSNILLEILEIAAIKKVESLWIGRDLGYKGGRRTGLALTDEAHLCNHSRRWGKEFFRTTTGEPAKERTATIIWDVLDQIDESIFLWNVFPFHPYINSNPFTNRQHSSNEKKIGEEILILLIELISPKQVIAIGNDADNAIKRICPNLKSYKVRHPSYGGHRIFQNQINEIYKLKNDTQLNIFNDELLY